LGVVGWVTDLPTGFEPGELVARIAAHSCYGGLGGCDDEAESALTLDMFEPIA
jgi:hypothetical protein